MSHLPPLICYSEIESRKNSAAPVNGGRAFVSMEKKQENALAPDAAGKPASGKSRKKKKPKQEQISSKTKLREELVHMILTSGKEIIKGVLGEAKKGNYLPAKYLFEFAGISEPLPELDADALARVKSLTEILFESVQNQKCNAEAEPTPAAEE